MLPESLNFRHALLRLKVKVKSAKSRYKQNVLPAKDSDEFTKKRKWKWKTQKDFNEMKLKDAGQQNKCRVIVLSVAWQEDDKSMRCQEASVTGYC